MARAPEPPYAVVVDCDPASRELLGDALYRYGLVPLLVASGADAIELLAGASAPVLVVLASAPLDIPPARLLATLRADERWASARVLLAASGPAEVPEGLRVDGVIPKPFDGESLFRAVMRAAPGALRR
jgi:CheY-like chemotaxis protein